MAAVVLHGNFSIEVFDPTTTEWARWLQRFQAAVKIFKIPTEQQVLYLLHFIGASAFDVICNKLAPVDPYTATFDALVTSLAEFYAPEPLEIAENFRFHQRKQKDGESVKDFVAALHKVSARCNFGTYLKTALRNQFVFGLASSRAQSRLLEMKDLTFEKAIQVATSMELSEKDTLQLQNGPTSVEYIDAKKTGKKMPRKRRPSAKPAKGKSEAVNGGKANPNSNTISNISCFRCGGSHLATKCTLDRSVKCHNCGTPGHLRKVCMAAKRASANQVEEILVVEHPEFRDKFFEIITVEGKPLRFEVDSGAAVTIVSTHTLQDLLPFKRLQPTTLQLITFCKTSIKIVGVVPVMVSWRETKIKLNLYVSNVEREPLLGREWIRQLHIRLTDTVNTLNTSRNVTEGKIAELLQQYRNKLDPHSTKIRGLQAKLTLKDDVRPVFLKARIVPFKLLPLVDKELQSLVSKGILEKVNTSRWATPIVPVLKKDNTVRLCGDFSVTINPCLQIDEHPLPTTDTLFANMAGGKKFSKIDLQQAYLQLEVREEDRELLTLNTHRGLFRSTRLMYGNASAPAIWQREMENLLQGIEGVTVFLDDIRVTGPTEEIHLERLKQVLQRLGDANIRINESKSEFLQDSIHYCGYRIDRSGIHKTTNKMQAIDLMPRPKDITELRSFLGMVNYYGRFIRNLSTMLTPLHDLLQKGIPFKWTHKCEEAFECAKKSFKSDTVLAHFDPKLPLILATDASSYGVGAVLSHRYPDGTERVLQYASQSFSKTQQRYAQIDKEAYAIIYGIKKFHQYLYGNKFTLYTDHKPLVQIFAPSKEKLAGNCDTCNTVRNNPPKAEIHEWEPAGAPFERVHVDYAGPFMNAYFFVFVDAFSKWPFVRIVKNITAETTIKICKEIFTDYGLPKTMVMDNGRNFRSTNFTQFLESQGITPKFTAPYHPATNGQAERFVQTLKNSLKKTLTDPTTKGTTLENALRNFLVQYRTTPHCTTGVTPFERMFRRKMRTEFTLCIPESPKKNVSTNTNKKSRKFTVGESVICRNYNSKIKWKFGKIVQRLGKLHYKIKLEDGRTWERHVDQIRKRGEQGRHPIEPYTGAYDDEPDAKEEPAAPNDAAEPNRAQRDQEEEQGPEAPQPAPAREARSPDPGQQRERPVRNKRPPERYTDPRLGRQ